MTDRSTRSDRELNPGSSGFRGSCLFSGAEPMAKKNVSDMNENDLELQDSEKYEPISEDMKNKIALK